MSAVADPLWNVYEQMGAQYERHAADGAFNAHYDRPAVLDALGPVDGLDVLDAACGPGFYAEELVARGARVSGFDASTAMVELARQRLGDRVELRRAVLGEALPYPDDTVDAAVYALAIHYVADERAAYRELHRIVRPGGVLVVSTQHPTADWLRLGGSYFDRVLEEEVWAGVGTPTPVRYWREPLTEVCAAATDVGWLIERLVEPRPAESMRERSPEHHARLSREPGFLVLRLRKP